MSAQPNGILTWNIGAISKALKIGEADVHEYFTDGRRVSFILERRLACEVVKGNLAPSEGAGYDLLDSQGRKWEVRSITRGGIYFCPSYMVGSGRSFNEPGFLEKLREIEGYIISDVESFPNVPFWILAKATVKNWWLSGKLGTSSKISRTVALKLLQSSL
jgi:hypothetical protein